MITASNIRSNVYQTRKNGNRKLSNGNALVKHRATTTKLPLLSSVSGVSERQGTATVRNFSTGSKDISREDSISKWILDREHLVNATRKFLPVLTERGGFVYAEAWAFNEEKTGLRVYDTFHDDSFTAIADFEKAARAIT